MSFSNEYTLNVDIKKRMSNVVPIFRQGDTAILKFRVYDNGVRYNMRDHTRSEITFELPSGHTLVNECTLVNDMIVYEFQGVEMEEVGNVSVLVSVYSGTSVVSVQPFKIHIYDNMRGQDLSYIKILQDLMKETQALKVELMPMIAEVKELKDDLNELSVYVEQRENERDEAESERIDSEDERIFNENERIQEEGQREDNETVRANNENTRISKENQRATSETNRVTAESTRVSNESNRVITEGLRVSAENARNTSETNRVTKENDRVAKETQRVNAETVRVTNETTRGNNEQSRSQAETLRSQNETTRTNAENIRKTNEITREQNELLRQETMSEMTEIVDNFDLRGQYSNSITYEKFNTVTYNGSSYMALKTVTGIVPTDDGVNWQLLAQRGVDGDGSVSSVNGIMPDTNGNVVIPATEAIDRLDSTSTTNALSANKGRELKEMLDNIEFDASDVIVTSETEPTTQSENYLWFDVSDTAFDSIDIENAVVSSVAPSDTSQLWMQEIEEGKITLKKFIGGTWKTLNPKSDVSQIIDSVSGKNQSQINTEITQQFEQNKKKTFDDMQEPYYIAHRGGLAVFPEHSMEAYQACLDLGFNMIEQDIRKLADGTLAVIHDATLDRTTDLTGNVVETTAIKFKNSKIDSLIGWDNIKSTTMSEVFNTFKNDAIYVIELKSRDTSQDLVDMINRMKLNDYCLIQSAVAEDLAIPIQNGLPTLLLSNNRPPSEILALGVQFVGVSLTVDEAYVTECINAGLKVIVYTVNRRVDHDRFLALGVSGFFTDDPLWISRRAPKMNRDTFADGRFTYGQLGLDRFIVAGVDNTGNSGNRGTFSDKGFGWSTITETPNITNDLCLMGWANVLPQQFTLDFFIEFDSFTPLNSGIYWGAVSFCSDIDVYQDVPESRSPKYLAQTYHLLIRSNGVIDLFKKLNGSESVNIGKLTTTAISVNDAINIELVVTNTGITVTRQDTGDTMTVADTDLRGGYLHVGRRGHATWFRNMTIS